MKNLSYKYLITAGVCGALLAGCSSSSTETDQDAASSSQVEASQSMDSTSSMSSESSAESTSSQESTTSSSSQEASSSSSEKKSDSSKTDVTSEAKMNQDAVLLPTYFPTDGVNAAFETNKEEAYTVNYTDRQGNKIVDVSGTIYTDADTALEKMEDKMNGAVSVEPNQETDEDLGHGITGYGEGAAGNQYFSWEEGKWDFTIHSLTQDEMDAPGIAKKVVGYLEEHALPAPSEKGMVYMDYQQGGDDVDVEIMWQKEDRVYELHTSQVPLEALKMVVSMK